MVNHELGYGFIMVGYTSCPSKPEARGNGSLLGRMEMGAGVRVCDLTNAVSLESLIRVRRAESC